MIAINFDVMKIEFLRRFQDYWRKQVDNSALPAGSPMYYYCQGCGILVATQSESWCGPAPTRYCDSCQILVDHGMLDRLRKEAKCQVPSND